MDRRKFLRNSGFILSGLALSGSILSSCGDLNNTKMTGKLSSGDQFPIDKNSLKYFWGDLHNHCNLTYGHGDLDKAYEAAKGQLDFVSVTPHAMWPDIPGKGDPRLEWVIDYHESAFKRLRNGGWDKYTEMNKKFNSDDFVTFSSYECHSMKHGDHVVVNYDLDAPLVECNSVEDLKNKLNDSKCFITPHHMGYQEGYRGYNWDFFSEGRQTPFVEMYSRHGLAESDLGDYPYLHDMGPRHWEGTILYGLNQGHKFGIMGSTDQHAGYPGSYGDGRVGVLAKSLSREDLWEALANRKTCCVTGDRIKIDFRINDATVGDITKGNQRRIYLNVEGENAIDYIDIIKNGRTVGRISGPMTPNQPEGDVVRAKVKFEFGWNRFEEAVKWNGTIKINDGTINNISPCFRGAPFVSPQKGVKEAPTLVNKIISEDNRGCELEMFTTKNPNTTTISTQAVILDVTMPKKGAFEVEFNGKKYSYTLAELLEGTKTQFMNGWLSEAIQFHRAIPHDAFEFEHFMIDDVAEQDTDYYYVRVRQRDNQWAWASPIWVERV